MKVSHSSKLVLLIVLATTASSLGAVRNEAGPTKQQLRIGIDTTFGDRFHEAAAALRAEHYGEVLAKTDAALAMTPDGKNASFLYLWRGIAHEALGDFPRAISDYSAAIRSDSTCVAACCHRGSLYIRAGNYNGAIADLTRCLRDRPKEFDTYVARGGAYLKAGKLEAARRDFEAFLRAPTNEAWYNAARGKIYFALGQYQKAASEIATAKRSGSSQSYVLNEAAWLEATCPEDAFRDGKATVRDAMRACQIEHWKDPGSIDTLAAAYAEAGDFDRAIATVNQAIRLEGGLPAERKELETHLQLFQQRKPYREESKFKRSR